MMEIQPCMPPGGLEPYRGPAAWTGTEMENDESWILVFTLDEIEEIEAAMRSVLGRQIELTEIGSDAFRLPGLMPKLAQVRNELESGRGFVLMRGLPLRRYTLEEAQVLFWGLGTHLGAAVSQNAAGDRIGHVRTVEAAAGDPSKRGYMKRDRAPFHTDSSDVVGLLCWRKAKRGGESFLVSAMTVHNIMFEERPDLLEVLYQPFFFDKKDEQQPGTDPYYRLPVFSWNNGLISTRYSRQRIETGQRFADVPRLTKEQIAAMDYMDIITEREGIYLSMDFQVGDIQLLNNYVIFHSRKAYQDYNDASERRYLLRLWLALKDGRPLPPSFLDIYNGDLSTGHRGGIPPVAPTST